MQYYTEAQAELFNNLEIKGVNTNKKVTYLNVPCAFDIETTSMIIKGEKFSFSYMCGVFFIFIIIYLLAR